MQWALKTQYEDALVASGLIDDVTDVLALDPLLLRLSEGDFLCRRGDKADRLWVLVRGSVAVRDGQRTIYVRHRPDVVGELNILSDEGIRWYDLVANESLVEVLTIRREKIEHHPRADMLWRNIARIISLKLTSATLQTADLLEQVRDDTSILHAYTSQYALSRRLGSGGRQLTEPKVEETVVWFSDIFNFTRSVLEMPPARTADLVQRFFNAQAIAIERHSGHIDKFMGDGLMAFWILSPGDQKVCAATCKDALEAAEEAVQAVSQIHVGNEPLELRVGLHVGSALSGDFGSANRHQFTLIGATVNKASQLEQVHADDVADGGPKPGPVRISAEFHEQLPAELQQRYAQRNVAITRKTGRLTLYSAPKF